MDLFANCIAASNSMLDKSQVKYTYKQHLFVTFPCSFRGNVAPFLFKLLVVVVLFIDLASPKDAGCCKMALVILKYMRTSDIYDEGIFLYFQAGSSIHQRAYTYQSVYCASNYRALFQGYTCQLLSYLLAALARPSPGTTRGRLGAHLSNIEEREKPSGHGEYLKKPVG